MVFKLLGLQATGLVAAGVACAATAHAEEPVRTLHWNAEPEAPADTAKPTPKAKDRGASGALDDAQLSPFTIGAPIWSGTATMKTLGGYDSASGSGIARTASEASVTDFLALRVEYEHGPGTGTDDRVTVGARVAFLTQQRHGIDGGFGFFYDAKDFRNEGNFVGALLVGRHFGRFNLYGNAFFGMDSEGDDQSAELRVGSGYRLAPSFQVGFDTRGRLNMSTDEKRIDARATYWELQATPLAAWSVGPLALTASVGPSVLSHSDAGSATHRLNVGVLALGGAGAAF